MKARNERGWLDPKESGKTGKIKRGSFPRPPRPPRPHSDCTARPTERRSRFSRRFSGAAFKIARSKVRTTTWEVTRGQPR